MKIILPVVFASGHSYQAEASVGHTLGTTRVGSILLPCLATELPSPRIDSARFIEDLSETPHECTFPLSGTGMRRASVMEGPMCMNGQLPNELLVDEGRLTLTDATRLGLITQFQ